ncbi:hypothetical protein CK203_038612 [Vitis vinifera]|uniref:Uncharacterized protein n=1 Tax=Vitis vinifera TaxID=29760 RepID=A0A438I433_VITVI|nr:hypothetical protein CK203_038612 [Vitis vinifera]
MGVLIMAYTFNQLLDLVSLASQMLIGSDVLMIQGLLMASMFFLVLTLSHGVHAKIQEACSCTHYCGILPKNCHVASSLLDTQTSPFRCVASFIPPGLIPPGCLTSGIMPGRHLTFSECLTAAILPGRHPTFSGYLTAAILPGRHPTFSRCLTAAILSGRRSTFSGYFTSGSCCRIGRFNFPGQTCSDPSITLIRITSVANDSDSPDSLARQILAIHRIHFRPQ